MHARSMADTQHLQGHSRLDVLVLGETEDGHSGSIGLFWEREVYCFIDVVHGSFLEKK